MKSFTAALNPFKKLSGIVNPELLFWVGGLLVLALYPFGTSHFSICPISNLGFSFCPGCGLGMSLHHLLHFEFYNSFQSHPLGIFALVIIVMRIYKLTKTSLTHHFFLTKRNYNV